MLNLSKAVLTEAVSMFEANRSTIEAVLDKEHNLILQALRLGGTGAGGKSGRMSMGASQRASSGMDSRRTDPEEVEVVDDETKAKQETTKEVNESLSAITSNMNKIHGEILGVRMESDAIAKILTTLGMDKGDLDELSARAKDIVEKEAADAANQQPGRRRSRRSSSLSPLGLRLGSNKGSRTSAGENADDGEKREITGVSKEHRNSASAAAMVL